MIIYLAHNKINHKNYVGQTISDLRIRKNNHYRDIGRSNSRFSNALGKYNKEDFEWTILRECRSIEELNNWEIFYIKLLGATDRYYGYNITNGGLNALVTNETRAKLSKASKGRKKSEVVRKNIANAIKRRTQTEEYRKNFSERITGNKIWLGRKHKEDSKRKISESNIGKHSETWKGKNHSEETKRLMSEKAKLIWANRKAFNGIIQKKAS